MILFTTHPKSCMCPATGIWSGALRMLSRRWQKLRGGSGKLRSSQRTCNQPRRCANSSPRSCCPDIRNFVSSWMSLPCTLSSDAVLKSEQSTAAQDQGQPTTPRGSVPEPGAEWVDVGSPASFGLPDSPKALPTPGKNRACHMSLRAHASHILLRHTHMSMSSSKVIEAGCNHVSNSVESCDLR